MAVKQESKSSMFRVMCFISLPFDIIFPTVFPIRYVDIKCDVGRSDSECVPVVAAGLPGGGGGEVDGLGFGLAVEGVGDFDVDGVVAVRSVSRGLGDEQEVGQD